MILKKLFWVFKRHPILYITRFKLLSKNVEISDVSACTYNKTNRKEDIPAYYKEINEFIFKDSTPESDLSLIQKLSVWLQNNIKGGPGLSEPSEKALRIMLDGKGGVCSDMAQIFNNFCVINSIKVREWGTTRAPFNTEYGGHSFNEVFSKELNKWVLIDVYNGFTFFNEDKVPLSVIELFQLSRNKKTVHYKSFNENKPLEEGSVYRNYLNKNTVPFLICNYNNKTYDVFLKYTRPYIPVFITHFVLFIFRKSYHYRFPLDNYKIIFS